MQKLKSGFSIIEILVVLFVFSILGVVVARSLALSLQGSNKSDSTATVKTNVEYAASAMERMLRNAKSVTCVSTNQIDYVDEDGNLGRFSCLGGDDGYISSGAASPVRITSTEVDVLCTTQPIFSCTSATQTVPASVTINMRANHNARGAFLGGSQVSVQSRVQLRSY